MIRIVTDKLPRSRVCDVTGPGDRSTEEWEVGMEQRMEQPNRVMAIFHRAALSFDLRRDATLGELAQELNMLGEIYGGTPLYVDVRIPD
jgi:hypothetical protein